MSTKYTPRGGEVAMITFGGSINENGPAFYVVEMDREDRWVFPDGTEEPASYPKSARPLVVIDPEDPEHIERLVEAMVDAAGASGFSVHPRGLDNPFLGAFLVKTLQCLANPAPPMEEPTNIGAVIQCEDGSVYVRVHAYGKTPWARSGFGEEVWPWADLERGVEKILHPGYAPEAQS